MKPLFRSTWSILRHTSPKLFALVLVLVVLYYLVGMIVVHRIHDDTAFQAETSDIGGGSHAVAVVEAMMAQEMAHWTPNDPIIYPGWMLTRMPAFQRGMVSAVARFTLALNEQIARTRGSSTADPDLQKAVGLFNYPPTVWIYDISVSWLPTASSESQYKSGIDALAHYNERLSKGKAVFERRSDNLLEVLERFALDLGSSSGATEEFVGQHSALAFFSSARLYYETKGKLLAYYLILRELGKDYQQVIQERQIQALWDQMLENLRQAASQGPYLVINGKPDSALVPSHLAGQGFYVMRARTHLREITNVLLK